jgi:hypothetical protein
MRRGGRTLLAVRAGSRMDEADDLLHRFGAYDVEHRDRATMAGGTTTPPSGVSPTGRWEDYAPAYRSRWQERAGTAGGTWDDAEPRYRYGWEARNDPRYRDRLWPDLEADLRRDWEGRHPDRPWDEARENVREAWEGAAEPAHRGS